jgi:hypothetical protein
MRVSWVTFSWVIRCTGAKGIESDGPLLRDRILSGSTSPRPHLASTVVRRPRRRTALKTSSLD